jgi:serine/threonine protein kinase
MNNHVNPSGNQLPYNIAARYAWGDVCRKGKFAEIRFAKSKVDGTLVEVKIVPRINLKKFDEDSLKREYKLTNLLRDSKAVVEVYEFFQDAQFYYIVLQHCKGGDLFDRIVRKTCYTEAEARSVMRLLVHTIHLMHSRNIVHRFFFEFLLIAIILIILLI